MTVSELISRLESERGDALIGAPVAGRSDGWISHVVRVRTIGRSKQAGIEAGEYVVWLEGIPL